MDRNDYISKLNKLETLSETNFKDLGVWVENEALPWLWDELGGVIIDTKQPHPLSNRPAHRQPLTPMSVSDAVRNGLIKDQNDPIQSKPPYYRAQMTMLNDEILLYCRQAVNFSMSEQYADAALHTLHRALLDLMLGALYLLDNAAREIAGVEGYYGIWRRRSDHPFEIFRGAEQVIYGTFSGLAYADRVTNMPVAVLRTAIELRLRHAFCVYLVHDPAHPENPVFVDLSVLYEAIKPSRKNITFSVDIDDVFKIYRWSNLYLHAGIRDYPWIPGFLLRFLHQFFVTEKGVDASIKLNEATWRAVRDAAEQAYVKPGAAKTLVLPAADPKDAQCEFR